MLWFINQVLSIHSVNNQKTEKKRERKRQTKPPTCFFTPNMEMETIKQIRRGETPAYFTLTWLDWSDACKRRVPYERRRAGSQWKNERSDFTTGNHSCPQRKKKTITVSQIGNSALFSIRGTGFPPSAQSGSDRIPGGVRLLRQLPSLIPAPFLSLNF